MYTLTTANSQSSFDDLKICHVNCQSLVAYYDEFHNFYITSDYHIICMTKMWLRPEVLDPKIDLAGFTLQIGQSGQTLVAFYFHSYELLFLDALKLVALGDLSS